MKKNSLILLIFAIMVFSMDSFSALNKANFEKAKECLGKRESNNNYEVTNTLGYMGRYQFGAQALEDIGYIKKGCYKKYKNAVPSHCWKKGIKNRLDFLKSHSKQDSALEALFLLNEKRLKRNKTLGKEYAQSELAQKLFVSHLLGTSAAKKYFKLGKNGKDAYGATAKEYSELAKSCIGE